MYSLRPHHLKPLRKYQRGNIIIGVGLPPTTIPPAFGAPSGDWELINQWQTSAGDLAAISAAFNGSPRGEGLSWSPDGTVLTLCSGGDDSICSFGCSTPFDPETATLINKLAVTNPQSLHWNSSGTQLMVNVINGDFWVNYPGSGFVIGNGPSTSAIAKANVGYTSGDGNAFFHKDFEYFCWEGNNDEIKYITTPGGDLSNFNVVNTFSPLGATVNLIIGYSPLTKDEKMTIRGTGSVAFVTMAAPTDIDSITFGPDQFLGSLTYVLPKHVWFNPLDTSEIWCIANTQGIKLCRLRTNAPTF